MDKNEAMKLALEAYLQAGIGNSTDFALQKKAHALAVEALKATAAVAPEQEPVAWIVEFESGDQELHFDEQSVGETQIPLYTTPQHSFFEDVADDLRIEIAELQDHVRLLEKQLAQQEQSVSVGEPVAADDFFKTIADRNPNPFPIQQRQWVDLTETEMWECESKTYIETCKALIVKLKGKNNE
jgi:hypothetical protein